MGKLTVAKMKSIIRAGLHGDGGVLYLSVAPGDEIVDSKTYD